MCVARAACARPALCALRSPRCALPALTPPTRTAPLLRAGQEPEQGHGGLWRRRAGSNGDWVLLHVRRRRAVRGPRVGGGAAPRGGAVAGHGQQGQRALGLGAAILGGVDDTRRARFHPAQLLFPSEALPTRLPRRLKRIKGDLPSVERSVHRRASAFVGFVPSPKAVPGDLLVPRPAGSGSSGWPRSLPRVSCRAASSLRSPAPCAACAACSPCPLPPT